MGTDTCCGAAAADVDRISALTDRDVLRHDRRSDLAGNTAGVTRSFYIGTLDGKIGNCCLCDADDSADVGT